MKEVISNYYINKEYYPVVKKDAYVVKNPNKFKNWLLCILLKFNIMEHETIEEIKYSRVEIHKDKIIELIRELMDEIYFNTGNEPRQLIIGYDKMRQLNIECYDEMRFSMPLELNGSKGKKIFGLDIMLNPRIDGLVLV
jgi:hypothetical protein